MWRKLATNKNDQNNTKSNQVDKNCPTSNPLTKNVHVIRDILDFVQSLYQSKNHKLLLLLLLCAKQENLVKKVLSDSSICIAIMLATLPAHL